jgi:hypothetical protein
VPGDLGGDGLSGDTAWSAWEVDHQAARPPMSAERTTFASATTAGGSEIAEHLLLVHVLCLQRRADLLG